MQKKDDYYKLLQVHYLAEPEVIESTYKRLARKYHPDINKSADAGDLMKCLNQAYEVLSDPEKRKAYNLKWLNQQRQSCESNLYKKRQSTANKELATEAKSALDTYFTGVAEKRFEDAYNIVSDMDKETISLEDFIAWQEAVSGIYHLSQFNSKLIKVVENKKYNGHFYKLSAEFIVCVSEYNSVMDLEENNTFLKRAVWENNKWKVFLGYRSLKPLIKKFSSLRGLLTAKTVMSELMEGYSRRDPATGLLNQKGILEKIENEVLRYSRYGNIFSLVRCDICIVKSENKNNEEKIELMALKEISRIFIENLRKLDVVGRWGESSLLLLLPETKEASAMMAAKKLNRIFKKESLFLKDVWRLSLEFKVVEYQSSIEKLLARIHSR